MTWKPHGASVVPWTLLSQSSCTLGLWRAATAMYRWRWKTSLSHMGVIFIFSKNFCVIFSMNLFSLIYTSTLRKNKEKYPLTKDQPYQSKPSLLLMMFSKISTIRINLKRYLFKKKYQYDLSKLAWTAFFSWNFHSINQHHMPDHWPPGHSYNFKYCQQSEQYPGHPAIPLLLTHELLYYLQLLGAKVKVTLEKYGDTIFWLDECTFWRTPHKTVNYQHN